MEDPGKAGPDSWLVAIGLTIVLILWFIIFIVLPTIFDPGGWAAREGGSMLSEESFKWLVGIAIAFLAGLFLTT